MSRAALVYNPAKVDDVEALAAAVRARSESAGWDEPLVAATTRDDPGGGMARAAVEAGVDVVLAAGGDGTVRACITTLAGTAVALALVPAGTGNLLARNLELVHGLDEALDVAFSGHDRVIDVGFVDDEGFAVMAGLGFDAAMVADAPAVLKDNVGSLAYVVSAARHLQDRRFRVELRVDGGAPVRRRARSVLVANVGGLQAGLEVFPDAEPDDGALDVAVVSPRSLWDWAVLVVQVLRRNESGRDRRFETFRGRDVRVRTRRPVRRQLDGDPVGDGDTLDVSVRPRCLTVKVSPAA